MTSDVGSRVVRVLPDVAALDRTFDYVVPEAWAEDHRAEAVAVGSLVRVDLHGRRVAGWVVDVDVEPPPGVALKPLARWSSLGPPPSVVDLCRWGAHRWLGRWSALLRAASPPGMVHAPVAAGDSRPVASGVDLGLDAVFDHPVAVVRQPVNADRLDVPLAAARRGPALVIAPSVDTARTVAVGLRRAGADVALLPDDWARAAAGGRTVVGARTAAWAPCADVTSVVVLDEHDEALKDERTPSWHARDVAVERARRAGIPCVLVSPMPTLEAMRDRPVFKPSRSEDRASWPIVDLIDRRSDDPVRSGLLSERLVDLVRGDATVACVLNRLGRSRLLACAACGEIAHCGLHRVPLRQDDEDLVCPIDGESRPPVCEHCGGMRLKNLRAGVHRVREELEVLAQRPVHEVTGTTTGPVPDRGLFIGTEALLHRLGRADTVVFLDFDQELLAPRYRAAEQAFALLVRAARLLGPRGRDPGVPGGHRLVVQTRQPRHEVLEAAVHADPSRLARFEAERRRVLERPPFSAEAAVSGSAAATFVERLGRPLGLEILGPSDGTWLVRARDHDHLLDPLAAVERPGGRLRVEVDPLHV